MNKTTFLIKKMDCPSEEQMIRMKLGDIGQIISIEFDIPNRKLVVYHHGDFKEIDKKIEDLKFDSSMVETNTVDFEGKSENRQTQSKLLWQVFTINFILFLIESIYGYLSKSMGLFADSLDMLADSLVYILALLAVGGSIILKKRISFFAGLLQFSLAIIGLIEVILRYIGIEEMPRYDIMIIVSFIAAIGNGFCLYLLQKSKSQEAHMRATIIFTSNDIIVNMGVIVAGILVSVSESKIPDLAVGAIVFLIVGKGALKIFSLSK